MNKTTAIFLLLILLFNVVGYRVVFNCFEKNAAEQLNKKIDQQTYNKHELKEMVILLDMPYYSDRKEENIYGEIEWQGKHYQFVKRSIQNNILHIWCLSNEKKDNLVAVKNGVAKSTSSESQSEQHKSSTVLKILQTEYLQNQFRFLTNCPIEEKQKIAISDIRCASQHNPSSDFQPPRV